MKAPVIVNNLTKKYGSFIAVSDLSFSIQKNEIFALIGPNGAGKSTTLRILATVLNPTSGKVEILGKSVTKDSEDVRKTITYLPEEAGVYKNMTGKGYLKFMASVYTEDKSKQQKFLRRGSDIADLGKRLDDKVGSYSKGMTRKLLLARAIMVQPKLAILDEPTSGLDVQNSLIIRKIIRSLSKEGMSVLLSSHNMLEIEFLSDRIGLINKGKMIETGTAEQLKTKYNATNLEEVFELATSTND